MTEDFFLASPAHVQSGAGQINASLSDSYTTGYAGCIPRMKVARSNPSKKFNSVKKSNFFLRMSAGAGRWSAGLILPVLIIQVYSLQAIY